MHNTIQELKGNIRVFCRIRPLLGKFLLKSLVSSVTHEWKKTLLGTVLTLLQCLIFPEQTRRIHWPLYVTRRPDPDRYREIHIPLHFRLLFQEEGTYQKKLYVKTFPSTNRGHQKYIGRTIQLSRPLSFAKGVLKSKLFYIVINQQ